MSKRKYTCIKVLEPESVKMKEADIKPPPFWMRKL